MTKRLRIIFMIIIFLIPLIFYPLSVNADIISERETIDEFVTNYMECNGLPGVSIVIVKDGKVIYEKGYGHDSEGKPLTEKSLMRIGSVSKSFTAFAVLQLVDEGKINLDDPIVKYLSELTMDDTRLQKVTIRHLLSHTSGIPNPTIVPPANTLKAGVNRLDSWKLQWQPGDKYLYSNANYWILARLVEVVSGMEFSEYLRQNLFSPLGMDDTLSATNSGDPVKGLSQGYITAYGTALPWTELEKMFSGSGGVISTAADMGKWLSLHTNEGKNANGERLLSKALLEESHSPQPGSPQYGLGWSLSSPNVKPARISHSGALSTIQAQQDITLIYLFLGIKGIIRSKEWSNKRKQHTTWRYYLRLMPQVIPSLFIGCLFFIVPNLQNNSATITDVFGIWLATFLFLTVVFLIGVGVTFMRIYYRRRLNRNC